MLLRLLFGILPLLIISPALGADQVRTFVEGAEHGTHAKIARSISAYVAEPAGIGLDVRYSTGPYDTLVRMRNGSGQQFAVLQADVAQAFLGAVARGSVEAGVLLTPVRVISPISEVDIYFVVRRDSPLNFVHEIENARINVGVPNSGTALTISLLYRLMFNAAVPEQQTSFHSHQTALAKLTEKKLDVVALVVPRPAKLLADMRPEARRYVKLLQFDASHPSADSLLKTYSTRIIPFTSYPNLLGEDLLALVNKIYLISNDQNDWLLARFANSWCQNALRMRDQGHPALRELELGLPQLATGWLYSRPFGSELSACMERNQTSRGTCSPEDRALGLCV